MVIEVELTADEATRRARIYQQSAREFRRLAQADEDKADDLFRRAAELRDAEKAAT